MAPTVAAIVRPVCHGPETWYPISGPYQRPYFLWNSGYAKKLLIKMTSYLEQYNASETDCHEHF